MSTYRFSLAIAIYAICILAAAAACPVPANGSESGPTQDQAAHDAQVWDTRSTQIDVNGRTFELILRYTPGDLAWADRVQAFVPSAIPALEQAIGVPYPGPPAVRITEKTGPEMFGASGVAACNESMCGLAVGPDYEDQVLLHEIGHVWTYAFKNRWLAEGTAEFASIGAARNLGIPVRDVPAGNRRPAYPLDEWGSPVDFQTADDATIRREIEGYDRATRLLQIIQSRSAPALATAYGAVMDGGSMTVESERFMDALEDAGGGSMDDLFAGWVFSSQMGHVITERRAARTTFGAVAGRLAAETPELGVGGLDRAKGLLAEWKFAEAQASLAAANGGIDAYLGVRDRLNALRASVEATGLAYPIPFEQARDTLEFATVAAQVEKAEAAVAAYPAARDRVQAPRSNWQKLGLIVGDDPDALLEESEADFAWTRFDESIEKGKQAQTVLDGAAAAGKRNAAIGAGLSVVAVIVLLVALRWALSGQPAPAEG
jgi:hypothetical protein